MMEFRAPFGVLLCLTPEVLAVFPDAALSRTECCHAANDGEKTGSGPDHQGARPTSLGELAHPSAAEDDPGHHRGITVPVRRQCDSDPHQSQVRRRDHQVGRQGGQQPRSPVAQADGGESGEKTPAMHAANSGVWNSPRSGRG